MENDEVSKKPREYDISKQVEKEIRGLPERIREQYLVALERISWGLDPGLETTRLKAAGREVVELKINGRPAYRLVFTTAFPGKVVVLAARPKTCNGPDRQLVEVVASRLKAWLKAFK